MDIIKSAEKYEAWLRAQIDGDVNEEDLAEKHKKMTADAFQFLRATYWRWAETIYDECAELEDESKVLAALGKAPAVLAVGDIHVENFGTWRDAEGRLVWGVNDFDEAARMPYAIDLVRLATSAALAAVPGITPKIICDKLLTGYRDGIAQPMPFILDRENGTLRCIAVVTEDERTDFWTKYDPAQIEAARVKREKKGSGKRPKVRRARRMRPRYRKALEAGKPDAGVRFDYFERTAGTGSLGRPRYFGVGAWQGDLIVREAKAMVPSGWVRAHGGSRKLRCEAIATGKYRSPDPYYGLRGRVLLRRLSPNDFKIETTQDETKEPDKTDENHKVVERRAVVNADVLQAMGHELASIHRGTHGRRKLILSDLRKRGDRWLLDAMAAAKRKVEADFAVWAAAHPEEGSKGRKGKTKKKKKTRKAQ
jgi:hypothetical protein